MKKTFKKMISIVLAVMMVMSFNLIGLTASAKDGANKRYTVLCLDVSGTQNFTSNGELIYTSDTPIKEMKKATEKFISSTKKASGTDYIAIVAFSESAEVILDFTNDNNLLKSQVDTLTAKGAGTRRSIAVGLRAAKALIDKVPDNSAEKNVVLFSTGLTDCGDYNYSGYFSSSVTGSTWYNSDSGVKLYAYANKAFEVADSIKASGVNLYSIGLFQVYDGMPSQGQNVVTLFKKTAEHLASSSETYFEVDNIDELVNAFKEVAYDVTGSEEGLFERIASFLVEVFNMILSILGLG